MTIFPHKKPLPIPALLLLLALHLPLAQANDTPSPPGPFDAYKTKISNGITITYPPDEQPFVAAILQGYEFPLRLLDNTSFNAQLDRWKKNDLALIARTLALDEPTPQMETIFEQFRAMGQAAVAEEIREIRIYDLSDIKDAHARAIPIEGIAYVPQTDSVSISNYIATTRPDGVKFRVVPIVLMQKVPGMTDEKMRLLNGMLRDMRWKLDEAIYNAYRGKLYEIARPSISAAIDKSRFPLWLIDGMANALPFIVMRSHNPNLTFDQLLQAHSPQPPDLAALTAHMNLDTWAGTRTPSTPKAEIDAYTYLAMLATLDAVNEAGTDWIPELFKRLREENSPALNMANIYDIYSKLTDGKDLRQNIANVKERLLKK